jgi:predicted GIY-YIG superfamily endonuclease
MAFVYILTNDRRTVLYTGVTTDLERRVGQHKQHLVKGFTNRYNVTRLVYVEEADDLLAAIAREKQIKGWRRDRKAGLIESINPDWIDLAAELGS